PTIRGRFPSGKSVLGAQSETLPALLSSRLNGRLGLQDPCGPVTEPCLPRLLFFLVEPRERSRDGGPKRRESRVLQFACHERALRLLLYSLASGGENHTGRVREDPGRLHVGLNRQSKVPVAGADNDKPGLVRGRELT